MKYYFDTEFKEGPQQEGGPNVIDLISIGIVNEEGGTYYAISNEFNLEHAWGDEWIKENVLKNIFMSCAGVEDSYLTEDDFTFPRMGYVLKTYGQSRQTIKWEIEQFVGQDKSPEFWAYYASTDWVAFYQLWGCLMNIPPNFPMYVKDLKNLMDFHGLNKEWKRENCPEDHDAHDALADAQWNMKLHETIQRYTFKEGQHFDGANDYMCFYDPASNDASYVTKMFGEGQDIRIFDGENNDPEYRGVSLKTLNGWRDAGRRSSECVVVPISEEHNVFVDLVFLDVYFKNLEGDMSLVSLTPYEQDRLSAKTRSEIEIWCGGLVDDSRYFEYRKSFEPPATLSL